MPTSDAGISRACPRSQTLSDIMIPTQMRSYHALQYSTLSHQPVFVAILVLYGHVCIEWRSQWRVRPGVYNTTNTKVEQATETSIHRSGTLPCDPWTRDRGLGKQQLNVRTISTTVSLDLCSLSTSVSFARIHASTDQSCLSVVVRRPRHCQSPQRRQCISLCQRSCSSSFIPSPPPPPQPNSTNTRATLLPNRITNHRHQAQVLQTAPTAGSPKSASTESALGNGLWRSVISIVMCRVTRSSTVISACVIRGGVVASR